MHHAGTITFRSDTIYLAKALEGETVLLEPADHDWRFVDVYFLDFHIGTIDTLYGTTKDVTLCSRGNVTHETGHIGDGCQTDEFDHN